MFARICLAFIAVSSALIFFASSAQARTTWVDHGGNYFGDVYVQAGQTIDGDLNVVGGTATIAGTVNGDVSVVGGNVVERPGAMITGHVNTLGGSVIESMAPWFPQVAQTTNNHFDGSLIWRIAASLMTLLIFLIFPLRTKIALDRLERHPGLCTAAGLIAWIAVIPLAFALTVTIILIPLVFVEFIVLIVGVYLGKAALSLLIGRRLFEMLSPQTTPTPFSAFLLGLALLTAAELVPFLGVLVTGLIWLIGVGSAALAFIGEQHFTAMGTRVATATGIPPTAPMSGPPATRA